MHGSKEFDQRISIEILSNKMNYFCFKLAFKIMLWYTIIMYNIVGLY